MNKKPLRPKFYLARRCTRWDVYPQPQPLEAIAFDWQGYWARTESGEWFLSPASYNFQREITEAEALAFRGELALSEGR